MKQFKPMQYPGWENHSFFHCLMLMILSIIPLLCAYWLLQQVQAVVSQCLLLFTGWFAWTGIEYLWHRFVGHGKHRERKDLPFARHMEHHHHPSQLKITAGQRLLMVAVLLVLAVISFQRRDYFTLITGLWMGYVWYNYMHVILHHRWSMKVFPRLSRYHLFHHCKNPDSCFGVSTRFWDDAFGTVPDRRSALSDRIIDFYFKEQEGVTAG